MCTETADIIGDVIVERWNPAERLARRATEVD